MKWIKAAIKGIIVIYIIGFIFTTMWVIMLWDSSLYLKILQTYELQRVVIMFGAIAGVLFRMVGVIHITFKQ